MQKSYLTDREVSAEYGLTLSCLRRWRVEKRGPKFIKAGRCVRYKRETLEHWLQAREVETDEKEAVA